MNDDILWKIDSEINKDKRVVELTKKCEILEENNKLLIQQKTQMYEDLDIAYRRIDKAIEYINSKLESLKMNKEAIMRILEPSNGYLLADVNYKIQKWERLLSILGGNNE